MFMKNEIFVTIIEVEGKRFNNEECIWTLHTFYVKCQMFPGGNKKYCNFFRLKKEVFILALFSQMATLVVCG